MYPFVRMAYQLIKHKNDPKLPIDGTHVSHHYCLPWDLDMWFELNNGRTLTLYDLGRIPFANRVGLISVLRRRKWGLTMAGACVRYRRRVRMFDKLEMRSRCIGYDDKFFYIQQSLWSRGEATSSVVYRTAVTNKDGIVRPPEILKELDAEEWNPEMPEWVQKWLDAESIRVWPPEC